MPKSFMTDHLDDQVIFNDQADYHVQQDNIRCYLIKNIYENIVSINKNSFAFTFITFTTQKFNANKM